MEQENLEIMNEQLIHENKSLKDDILIYKDDLKRLRDKIEKIQDENYTLKEKNAELEKIKKEHHKFSDGTIGVKELLKLLKESNDYTIYPSDNYDHYSIYSAFSGELLLLINDCYNGNLYPGLLLTPDFTTMKNLYNIITKEWEIYNHNNQKKYDISNKKYKDILDVFDKLCKLF